MRTNTFQRDCSTDQLDFLWVSLGCRHGLGRIDTNGRVFRDRLGTVGVPTPRFCRGLWTPSASYSSSEDMVTLNSLSWVLQVDSCLLRTLGVGKSL